MDKMTEQMAIEMHIEKCKRRIENIENFAKTVSDADKERCALNVVTLQTAIQALEEIQQYRAIGTVKEIKIREAQFARLSEGYLNDLTLLREYQSIGTVEELQNTVKEEGVLKFYYIESEDKYVVGRRIDNFYYGEVGKTGLAFYMSRYLPWGEHVVAPDTLWKEHTYPSEPKEIPFFDWLQGFIKKECGGTIEELQALKEKSVAKSPERKYVKYGKHKWKRNENGEIDDWAWDFAYCNGVVCEACGKTVCVHCNPNYDDLEDCETEDWFCPTCSEEVKYKHHHCKCGQLLDWE